MSSFLDHIWSLLFPITCCVCGTEGSWLCVPCRATLPKELTAYCPICGPRAVHDRSMAKDHGFFFDELFSFLPYSTPWVGSAIHNLKYGGMFGIASTLATEFALRLHTDYDVAAVVVTWVPLHGRRLRERGFNQTELIGRVIARQLGLTAVPLIRKSRQPAAQATLHVQERVTNLRGVFQKDVPRRTMHAVLFGPSKLDEKQDFVIQGKTVILVDDVVTTGATLSEASRILKNLGAARIIAFTIAFSPLRNTGQLK